MVCRIFQFLCLVQLGLNFSAAFADDLTWPGFRGQGDSHSTQATLPLTWGDEKNVVWKITLPGYGQSSPVVWKDLAFVTTAIGDEKETLGVLCLKVATGEVVWRKEFPNTQKVKVTDYISRAAPTPVVDADRVYAFFESGDLYALTHAGEVVWNRSLTKDYGPFEGNHGIGSSPAQGPDTLYILIDHAGPSYLLALNKKTGADFWKKERPSRVSWSSPTFVPGSDGDEIMISSNGTAECRSARSGDLIWEVNDIKGNTVASPTVTPAAVLIGSGQPGENLLIRRGGKGNVGATHVAWRAAGVSSSFGSPLIHEGRAYFVSKANALTAVNMENGEKLWTERLSDSTWVSPVTAGDRIYFFCKDGTTVVIRATQNFEKLAENKLTTEDRVYGLAIGQGGFLIRTGSRLVYVHDVSGNQ